MPLAIFGIENDGLNLAVNLLILFLVVVYLALIAYTYLDARRRLEDPVLVACATVASLFPFVGTVVYSILRPPEFLEDKRERALEIRASELRVRQLEESSCPNCEHPVDRAYLRCPICRARIKDPCESCSKPIDPRWSVCPYCEAPTRRAAPEPERRPATGIKAQRPARAKRPVARSADGRGETRSATKQRASAAKPRQPVRRTKSGQSTQSGHSRPEPGDDAPPRTAPAP